MVARAWAYLLGTGILVSRQSLAICTYQVSSPHPDQHPDHDRLKLQALGRQRALFEEPEEAEQGTAAHRAGLGLIGIAGSVGDVPLTAEFEGGGSTWPRGNLGVLAQGEPP
jgi:hypothetical protein